jgi:PadR family transcriptional regulator, regulatory protein PadR
MSTTGTLPADELIGCPCSGGTLDKLIQPAILAVLAEGPIHGYGLAERIGALPAFAGNAPDMSGVYRFLKAMEGKDLVSSAWNTSEGGPAKKMYQLTAAGQRCLSRWVQTLEHYRDAVTALLDTARRASLKQGDDA